MLVNLLSRNSNFVQIVFCALFLALFLFGLFQQVVDWELVVGVLFFLLSILFSVLFFNNSNLIKVPSFAVLFFLSWVFVFSDIYLDYKISISLLSSTLIFWRLLLAERRPENKKFLFDIGLLISLSGLFYPPSFLMFFFLLFTFIYKQTVTLRGVILFVVGISLPLIVGSQVLFLIDRVDWLIEFKNDFELNYWKTSILGLIPIGILILIAWMDHFASVTSQDVNKRHYYFLAFLYFINWIVILSLYGGGNLNLMVFLGFPVAIFLTRVVQYQKNQKVKELFLWLYLAFITAFYFRSEISEFYQDLLGNVSF